MGRFNYSKIVKKQKEPKPVDAPRMPLHKEPEHDDEDPITASNFPFVELIPTWRNFDVNCKNAATGAAFASSHHGGNGGKKMKDFTSFNLACCLEFIEVEIDGTKHRVRCMNVFTVHSNQCTTHTKTTHKDGPNRIYTMMTRNEVATWGMIKDTDRDSNSAVVLQEKWHAAEAARTAAATRLEEAIESGRDAADAWASMSTTLDEELRIQTKRESEIARGKDMPVDEESDAVLDAANSYRAALDAKAKGVDQKRKTGARAAWRTAQLKRIPETADK